MTLGKQNIKCISKKGIYVKGPVPLTLDIKNKFAGYGGWMTTVTGFLLLQLRMLCSVLPIILSFFVVFDMKYCLGQYFALREHIDHLTLERYR
ncbi:hypothetical protein [Pelosinus sp. UFO1]|uniref:hypothetical protein n=1 Tax=Pelosinus sp. UFO1 TaxID=484770 RepID=UPI00056F11A6|nr:hypothetical protein [Pelosinus sp. UFO1]